MKKIKITKQQYDKIVLHEQKLIIAEAEKPIKTDLNVILGICLMLGLNVTGLNKERAEKALNDQSVVNNIKIYLEDKDKLVELIESMEQKGMSNPVERLKKDISGFIKTFNNNSLKNNFEVKLSSKALVNLHSLGID